MKFAHRVAGNRPIIISGDFNAEPIEPVYSTVINYRPLHLSSAYADLLASLPNDCDGAKAPKPVENGDSVPNGDNGESAEELSEAQKLVNHLISHEPPFTTWKIREDGEVCHTIDYVFYSSDKLKVNKFSLAFLSNFVNFFRITIFRWRIA